ncbi:hypothetical protein GGR05_000339 [Aureimonas phyllosphaerae]|uniref:Uncharacterized protein n=1 Tax=Aureimonas phyllosphaerae TaxID=1166078 RepID=A0A7W6BSI9_9HYPH|nr:hypothetical protein [Aureimonas phyllosphaerae]MBB3958556.1 hypothetical protein [Aureimonas phyllosphaerae]
MSPDLLGVRFRAAGRRTLGPRAGVVPVAHDQRTVR